MGRLSFGDKDEEEYDNRLIARGKVMANLKSLEVLVILFIYLLFYFSSSIFHTFFFLFWLLFVFLLLALNLSFTRFYDTRFSSLVLEGAWKLR